jgi:hypothetical protein
MTDEAMSSLRRRMIEDMAIRKLAPKTQQGYTHRQGFCCVLRSIARGGDPLEVFVRGPGARGTVR